MNRNTPPWQKRRNAGKRQIGTRHAREKILIVCEGEQTEPNYFKSFPVDKEVVEIDIRGAGKNTDSLVEEALRLKQQTEKNGTPYNQVWCVFDRDSFPKHNFNRAIRLALDNHLRMAYSNEAFEIWYLLHFHFFVDAADRAQYKSRLSQLFKYPYKKNSKTIYSELLDKQPTALKNARKLLNEYLRRDPEANNPSTTVHLLVEELNQRGRS